jgi:hypothetical protein
MKKLLLSAVTLFFAFSLTAQPRQMPDGKATVSGRVVDAADKSPLPGANVIFQNFRDTTQKVGVVTDGEGNFSMPNLRFGGYLMRVSYLGYQETRKPLRVLEEKIDAGTIELAQDTKTLGDVVVTDRALKVQQVGDTTQYNAAAVKTIKDANAEDLVSKMSGIQVQGGEIKAQGETVRRVTLDGREFFGEDATAALRSLPAEIVDKVQVFDQQSDQARFTGFDDGNAQKTINITTRQNRQNGQFGRLFGGYGTDTRYSSGGNVSYFKGTQRLTVVLNANNVNQQNFSSVDLLGMQSGGGGRGGMGGGMMFRGGGGGGGFGGGASDFFVGQQRGVSTTNAIGVNYSDNWGKNWKSAISLFVNHTDNENVSVLNRLIVSDPTVDQTYDEDADVNSLGFTNRFNARLEYTIDKDNSLVIQPRINTQSNELSNTLLGENRFDTVPVGRTESDYGADGSGYNLSNNILWRHRFAKPGRTVSVNLRTDYNRRNTVSQLVSTNTFVRNNVEIIQALDQDGDEQVDGYTVGSNVTFTENIGKIGQLQLNYEPSRTFNNSDRETYLFDTATNSYSIIDSTLTSFFDNTVNTQRAGVQLRYRLKKGMLSFGANMQYNGLEGSQVFPDTLSVDRTFWNILPTAMFQYRFTQTSNLTTFYRTSTSLPSVNQLQSVVNNTNPLQLSTGNPDLKQEVRHFIVTRYNIANPRTQRNFFAFALLNYRQNFIGNSTTIAENDTTLAGNISLRKGASFSRPVNLDGQWFVRSLATITLPVDLIKSNFTFNGGANVTRTPGLINGRKNVATTYGLNSGFVITSNISQTFDFTLSLDGTYNIVDNKLQPALNSNYYQHTAGGRLNWIFWKGFFLETSASQIFLSGLGADFDQNFVLWGGGIGKRFLKKERAELKLSVFDLLRQNDAVTRNVTDVFIDDVRNNVLTRYVMLTFTFNLRNFGNAPTPQQGPPGMGGPRMMMFGGQ